MTRPTCIALGILALAPGGVAGQETLTLRQALQAALAHNASLLAGRAAAAADAERIVEARSGWYPRVSVTESWQRGNDPVFVFSSLLESRQFAAANFAIDALNHPDPVGFFRTSIGVEQVLFNGGRQRAAVEGATLQHEVSRFSANEAAAGIALSTTQTFGRILTANARRRAAEADLAAAREDRKRAEDRRDIGMATDADVLALAAHVADLLQRVIQADSDAAVARAELNRLMGAPAETAFDVGDVSADEGAADANRPLEALLGEADQARAELRRARAAERLADVGRSAARSALIPQVVAQGVVSVSGTQFADRASAWVLGGEARWSLSLGGAELARIRAETESLARARAETEDIRAAIHVDVITALRQLESARARRTVAVVAEDQARESQRIIRDRFDAGLAGVSDVLRASSAVLDADAQQTAAMVDVVVNNAKLQRALGRNP
jgi:outer membrane protein TolC